MSDRHEALILDLAAARCWHTADPFWPCIPCIETVREAHQVALNSDVLRELGIAGLPTPDTGIAEAAVLAVLSLHRRARNTRACTGCPWTPPHPGGTSQGESTRRRNEDFNTHLATLITDLFR